MRFRTKPFHSMRSHYFHGPNFPCSGPPRPQSLNALMALPAGWRSVDFPATPTMDRCPSRSNPVCCVPIGTHDRCRPKQCPQWSPQDNRWSASSPQRAGNHSCLQVRSSETTGAMRFPIRAESKVPPAVPAQPAFHFQRQPTLALGRLFPFAVASTPKPSR